MVLEHPQTPEQVLGRYLRNLRFNRGWTTVELANRSGVARSSLSNIERGPGNQGISVKTLCKLARAFDMSPGEILEKSGYLELFKYQRVY